MKKRLLLVNDIVASPSLCVRYFLNVRQIIGHTHGLHMSNHTTCLTVWLSTQSKPKSHSVTNFKCFNDENPDFITETKNSAICHYPIIVIQRFVSASSLDFSSADPFARAAQQRMEWKSGPVAGRPGDQMRLCWLVGNEFSFGANQE